MAYQTYKQTSNSGLMHWPKIGQPSRPNAHGFLPCKAGSWGLSFRTITCMQGPYVASSQTSPINTFVCGSFTRKSRLGWPPMNVTSSAWCLHTSSPGYSQHPQPVSMMVCVPRAEERGCSLLPSKDQPPVCLSSVKVHEG